LIGSRSSLSDPGVLYYSTKLGTRDMSVTSLSKKN
jgi:hypothetical protein